MQESNSRGLKINPTILIIFSITVVSVMGNASIAPAFPRFRDYFGVTDSEVGWLITIFTIPGIFLIPVSGWLADKYGRKTILIPALILFGLSGVACFFAPSFEILLLLRFFQGVGSAPLNSLNNTLITDFFSGEKRVSMMGYNASVLAGSTAFYPAIGGALAVFGWNFPFLLPLLAFPLAILIHKIIREPSEQTHHFSTGNYWKTIRESADKSLLLIVGLVVLIFIFLYGVFITFFPFLMDTKFKYDSSTIGILMALNSLGAAIAAFGIAKASARINLRKALRFAFLLFAIGSAGIALSDHVWQLIIAIIIFGVATSLSEVSCINMISERAPKGLNGIFMAFNGMAILTGQTLGPAIMGWIVGAYSLHVMFLVAAGMALITFVGLFAWKSDVRKNI